MHNVVTWEMCPHVVIVLCRVSEALTDSSCCCMSSPSEAIKGTLNRCLTTRVSFVFEVTNIVTDFGHLDQVGC